MTTGLTVELDEDGIFSCEGPSGRHVLFFSGDKGEERWLLTPAVTDGNVVPPLLAWQSDLDDGLRLLVATSGSVDPFRVLLPSGDSFARPGKVPALEVMAALGYSVVRGLSAFVVVTEAADYDSRKLRRELVANLSGRPLEVGEVDWVEGDGDSSVWCCDLRLSFEGPLQESGAKALVKRTLAGSGLEILDPVELDVPYKVPQNVAAVLRFKPLSTAA